MRHSLVPKLLFGNAVCRLPLVAPAPEAGASASEFPSRAWEPAQHDQIGQQTSEYDDNSPDVEFEVSCKISVEPDLLSAIEKQAKMRKINTETLINLWLHEKPNEAQPVA